MNKDNLKKLLPPSQEVNNCDILLTEEAEYSVTPYWYNLVLVNYIKEVVKKKITIMDCTACVGGDTIGFAMHLDNVISIEKNKENFDCLVNNVSVYKLPNVSCILDDFFNIIPCLDIIKPNVIYFDPPWGGKKYKQKNPLNLYLNNTNIVKIIKHIEKYDFVSLIILKIPKNYKTIYFSQFKILKMKKFDFLIITPSYKTEI